MNSEVEEDSKNVEIIALQYEDAYDTLNVSSPHSLNSSAVKGKYYKQTYRQAWENMPDFKGWLRGVEGEPTRAYCIYCQKTLHAHRLSLLKHTCTIRHQKAAQVHEFRKGKRNSQSVLALEESTSNQEGMEGDGDETVTMVEYTQEDGEDVEHEEDVDQDHEEIEEETVAMEHIKVDYHKLRNQCIYGAGKPPISTHVVDTSKGQPVCGLQVSLYKLIDGRWTYINEGLTSSDGKFFNFLQRADFSPGRYKLHYDVDRYFESRKQESMYPFIEIVFDCQRTTDDYHVPLLLSPYGYTTYRD